MKAGDLVRVNYREPGLIAWAQAAMSAGAVSESGKHGDVGIVLGHAKGYWWSVLFGDRRILMDSKVLEVINEAR